MRCTHFGSRVGFSLGAMGLCLEQSPELIIFLDADVSPGEMLDLAGRAITAEGLSSDRNSVCYGLDPARFNALSDDDKITQVETLTFEALEALFPDEEQRRCVEATRRAHVQHGSLMEIVREQKVTKAYRVSVIVQVRPNGDGSTLSVVHEDLESGVVRRSDRITLHSPDDLYYLCHRIVARGGEITLWPRTSSRAQRELARYSLPVSFRLDEMQRVDPGVASSRFQL
jgi:hypothetical protein